MICPDCGKEHPINRERNAEAEIARLTDALERAALGAICGLCLDSITGQDTATVTRENRSLRTALLDFLSSHTDCAGKGECVCDDAWPLVGLPWGSIDLARHALKGEENGS